MDADLAWDDASDVVVIGFGAAGACASIEAADAGADVLVLDRFAGGGASAISGGVVYAGGGTTVQADAGVTDDVDAMFAYLQHETRGAVSDATLRRFCEESPAMIGWLQEQGVPFQGSLAPYKTSYPTNRHYLYYSGSELSARDLATPAPRGHGRTAAAPPARPSSQACAARSNAAASGSGRRPAQSVWSPTRTAW